MTSALTGRAPAGRRLTSRAIAGRALTGTGSLARLAFRRDRILLPAWIYPITALVASTAYTFKKLYPTAAARSALEVSGGGNPALRFLYGRLNGSSIGALTAWRYGVWAAIFGALMTIFIVIRHTRGDEEAGRLELVGAAAVGRQAALAAGLLTALAANVTISVLLCAVLPLTGLPAAGSVALALSIGACGLAFTGISAVAAQLTQGARAARGIAFALLGLAFVLRGAGDSASAGWLSWLSPLGWVELARPFAGQRWWVLVLPLGVLAAGTAAAFGLAAQRDQGAGLLPDRAGRATASAWLRGPLGLAWRLQRGTLAGWVAGFAVIFAVSGAAAKGIGSLLGGSTQLKSEFTRLGGLGVQAGLTNAYLASLMLLAGLGAAAYAISAVLRLRTEETDDRAEPVLATAVGRVRWGVSHVVVAALGATLLLATAALAAGLGYGLRAGSAGAGPAGAITAGAVSAGPEAARMLGAALAQLPAAAVLAGVAVALFGLVPRASVAGAWSALGVVVLLGLFGQALQLSGWVLDISPFTHAPKLPGGPVPAAPLLWLGLAALALTAFGLTALRRRDIG
jgi:ABC-2 type transport system permease protein